MFSFQTSNLDAVQIDNETAAQYLIDFLTSSHPPGQTRARRLVAIAEKAPEHSALRNLTWNAAHKEVMDTHDPDLYRKVAKLRPDPERDAVWIERVERENRVSRSQLEAAFNRAKSSGSKEVCRLAVKDLGVFFDESGDVTNALKFLGQVKDYSTTPQTHLEACLLVAEAALPNAAHPGGANFGHTYCTKAEAYLPKGNHKDAVLSSKVSCLLGLYELSNGDFMEAAKRFTKVSVDIKGKFSRVLAVEDAATYGALCALASFTRSELKELVVENANFKMLLETVPSVRALVMDFWNSRYLPLNQGLASMRGVLSLDVFLGRHVEALTRDIQKKAMCQYVFAYSTVKLDAMAAAFGTDAATMENRVSKLVASGDIQVRLDSQNQVLVAQSNDKRGATFSQALEMGRAFVSEAQSMLLRLDMLEKGIVYDSGKPHWGGRKKRSSQTPADDGGGDEDQDGYDVMDGDEDDDAAMDVVEPHSPSASRNAPPPPLTTRG